MKKKYKLVKRSGVWVLVDRIGCRPATDAEVYFFKKLKNKRSKK